MTGRLVLRDLGSGAERVLVTPLGGGGLPGRPSWSPDGRYLALCDRNRLNLRFREGYNVIRIVDTTTGTDRLHAVAPHVCIADRYDSGPVWSPDGRWMAVVVESALCLLPVAPTAPDRRPRTCHRTRRPPLLVRRLENSPVPLGGPPQAHRYRRARPPHQIRVPLDAGPAPADTVVHAGRLWTAPASRSGRRGHRRTRRTRRRSRAAPGP
ncbi:amidohydrolase, partial [Streptomyces mirabilis]|nr:amidohydrolase [Streptomyces mirabilis]